MITQAQIHANRLNTQKSTGPRTQKGKAAVSQNALKHGLSARCDVVITQSQADFDLHRDSLLHELAPQGPMESILADRIVSLSWRLKRADLIQNQTIDAMHKQNTTNPLTKLANSLCLKGLGTPHPEPIESNPDLTLGRIALKDFANARVLDRLLMYERRIENSLQKTILELQRLNLIRDVQATPSARPDPNPNVRATPRGRSIPLSRKYPESSIHNPESRILPSLPHIHGPFAQNKPNPQNPKTNATPVAANDYENEPRPAARKNKPNQTQSHRPRKHAKPLERPPLCVV